MALHGSAVLHTDCVYDDGVPEHTVVDAGPFRTTTTCTDLLPTLGTMDMYTVSSFLLRSARHLHRCTYARTHERTDFTCTRLLPCRPREPRADEPLAGGLSFACQSAVLYVLRCCCAGPALHPVSAYQWPPSALPACLSAGLSVCLPVCLSACLSACPPGQSPP